ncbi:MAG: DUF1553 domain-containing protein [Planctomycetota bacterium]
MTGVLKIANAKNAFGGGNRISVGIFSLMLATSCFSHWDGLSAFAQDGRLNDAKLEFFESKIRPALIEHCQDCHAADSEASGGLLLDSRDGWQAGGDSGVAIEAGKAVESLFFHVISYEDPDLQMPPDGKLPDSLIEDFKKWIDDGAIDPRRGESSMDEQTGLPVERAQEYWSYRPIERNKLANFGRADFIDGEIESTLSELSYSPLPPASDAVLVRRLYYDLVGLPPTENQIHAFVDSTETNKIEKLVEALLDSPQFGEQFARHWMDVARYAESITLRGFVLPEAWRYRDYLVQAYNNDRPFDQMIVEQIAGDLLESEDVEFGEHEKRLVATGFLALGNTNLEKQDKTQLEMDYIDEQLEVIGRAFLGQTIGCARCHDHKFDPIPTRDYYALAGIFRSAVALKHSNVSQWIERPLPLRPEEGEAFKNHELESKRLSMQIKSLTDSLELAKGEMGGVNELPGLSLDTNQAELVGNWRESQSVRGYFGDNYLVALEDRCEVHYSATLQGKHEVRLSYTPSSNRTGKLEVRIAHAGGVETVNVNQKKIPSSRLLTLGSFDFDSEVPAKVSLIANSTKEAVIADLVNFVSLEEQSLVDETKGPDPKLVAKVAEMESQIEALKKEQGKLAKRAPKRARYLTVEEKGKVQDIAIHIRGDVHNLGDVVPRGFLTAVGPREQATLDNRSSGRLEFGYWIASRDNPLTARVYANRVWTWLMGRGLVSTVNNFGTTGTTPSHPELLDGLAMFLQRHDWSTKALVRKIVLSDAYQRSSFVPRDNTEVNVDQLSTMREMDPGNAHYWRGHRRRLSVESLRDAMLSASGELDLTLGGSLIRKGTKSDYDYKHDGLRRSIYHPVFRNSLPELYEAFDFADTSVSVGQRPRSTVATQSLALMNHPWVAKRVAATAKLIVSETEGAILLADKERFIPALTSLYLRILGREPSPSEIEIAGDFLSSNGSSEDARRERLVQLIHSIFASIDFRYLE